MDNEITFDKDDLYHLRDSVSSRIFAGKGQWDVTDPDDWSLLVTLKNLELKLNIALDAVYDAERRETRGK